MARLQRRDRDAFALLIDRHQNQLVNYLTKLTGCRSRAEDLAQDTFLRLYEKASLYRERGSFMGYLYRIATNLLRSQERRGQRWNALLGFVAFHETRHDPTPRRVLLGMEASAAVESALAELPLRLRAPLVLREIEGLSYREIADAVDCRIGTVKSRISRAKEQLRESLRPYWKGDEAA